MRDAVAWVAAALLLAILVSLGAIAARSAELQQQKTICRASKGSEGYWAWREIAGRKCWFQGHRNKSKSELTWERPRLEPPKPEGGEDDGTGRRAGPGHNASPAPPPASLEARALTADDLLANTCCWPELEADLDSERKTAAPVPIPVPHFPAQPAPHWTWLWVLLAPAGYIAWVMLKRLASN